MRNLRDSTHYKFNLMKKRHFLIFIFLTITTITFGQQTFKIQIDYFGLITSLMNYKNDVSESYHLTRSWVFIDKKSDTPNKIKLKEFCQNGISGLNENIKSYSYLLDTIDLGSFSKITEETDKLVEKQMRIMSMLTSFNSYEDPVIVFELVSSVDEDGPISSLTNSIELELDKLIHKKTLEYIDLMSRQSVNLSSTESLKVTKIKKLLDLLNVSAEIKEILTIGNKSGLSKNYLEKDIYEILLQKYDKYYTIGEIDDLIAFYKTKTGKRMIKVSKKMMIETLTEIINTLN